MSFILKTGPLWQRAIDLMIEDTDKTDLDEYPKDRAIELLKKHGLNEQAREIKNMSRDDWDDFTCNHIF